MAIKATRPEGVAHHRWKVDKKFKPIYHAVQIYKLARSGLSDHAISKALGINYETYKAWHGKYPALYKVAADARGEDNGVTTFAEYVYGQLGETEKGLWDQIVDLTKTKTLTKEKLEEVLGGYGKEVRQSLFVHAWISANFNASEACRKVGISKDTLDAWINRDAGFRKLFEQINWHKGNFFEGALVKLVKSGDAAAIMFANKTFNRERGYAEKTIIENTHQVNINTQIPLEELDLDAATLSKILRAQRKYIAARQQQQQPAPELAALPAHHDAEDAEILSIKPKKKEKANGRA